MPNYKVETEDAAFAWAINNRQLFAHGDKWGELATFFKYPLEMRKLIYSSNFQNANKYVKSGLTWSGGYDRLGSLAMTRLYGIVQSQENHARRGTVSSRGATL